MSIVATVLLPVIIYWRLVISGRELLVMLSTIDILDCLVLRCISDVWAILLVSSCKNGCTSVLKIRFVIDSGQFKVFFVINSISIVAFGFISDSVILHIFVLRIGISAGIC